MGITLALHLKSVGIPKRKYNINMPNAAKVQGKFHDHYQRMYKAASHTYSQTDNYALENCEIYNQRK